MHLTMVGIVPGRSPVLFFERLSFFRASNGNSGVQGCLRTWRLFGLTSILHVSSFCGTQFLPTKPSKQLGFGLRGCNPWEVINWESACPNQTKPAMRGEAVHRASSALPEQSGAGAFSPRGVWRGAGSSGRRSLR